MLLHILLLPEFILRWCVHLHSAEYHIIYSCAEEAGVTEWDNWVR